MKKGSVHLIAILALVAIAAVIVSVKIFANLDQPGRQFEFLNRSTSKIESGFNTHLNTTGSPDYTSNLNLDKFKDTVDGLAKNNQKWIRLNIWPWESASSGNATNISWNEQNLQKYDEAINYARSKSLKIFLVTSLPDFANSLTSTNYKALNAKYHSYLANRYKGKITIWQVFNEADTHNFKGYAPIGPDKLTSLYLNDLKENIKIARSAIKAASPGILVTHNLTGYPFKQTTFKTWNKVLNTIAPVLDIISIDTYPVNQDEIKLAKSAISNLKSKYNKDIYVTEFGFPTADGRFSETDQAALSTSLIKELNASVARAMIYYQYSDTLPDNDKTESSFGVIKANGEQKSSYAAIMLALGSLLFSPPTPSPVSSPSTAPTATPTPAPTPTPVASTTPTPAPAATGLLRVITAPAAEATITVHNANNEQVLQKTWGVEWEKLTESTYKISFTYPYEKIDGNDVKLPTPTNFTIQKDKTTEITANLTNGTLAIN